ncbi:hypothetical protein ZIOFF_051748 [Zingiber officinale]|uniref:Uncharacterized protein n=1 Tax=Zingiber officinale TaxID=94328 RepID=A0A8J5FU07_ZINOF|nr:hypothetical protein ZIOFF_051748 [Zingiber officinale]
MQGPFVLPGDSGGPSGRPRCSDSPPVLNTFDRSPRLDFVRSISRRISGCLLRLVFANMAELLFEDIFTLTRIDPDGKKFDKGAELNGYKIRIANSYNISLEDAKASWHHLASVMLLDGSPHTFVPRRSWARVTRANASSGSREAFKSVVEGNRKSLADKFEYVMHGKLYKISEAPSGGHNVKVYVLIFVFVFLF